MKTYQLYGNTLDSLRIAEMPQPEPGRNQVLVRVLAASINYRDYALATGNYLPDMPRPFVPLSDGVGRIVALGPDVEGWKVGERVTGQYASTWVDGPFRAAYHADKLGGPLNGWLAEYIVLPATALLRVPDYLDDEQASTLSVSGLSAWTALQRVPHGPGACVLVQGTGSVSLMAVQLAAAAGAEVLATTSDEDKAALLKKLGASAVINYRNSPDLAQAVRESTGGHGVDGIVEVVGGQNLLQLLDVTADNAHIAIVGFLQGMDVHGNLIGPVIARQLNLHGVSAGSRRDFEAFLAELNHHRIMPVIGERFSFGDAPAAVASIARARVVGKPVVRIGV